MKATSSAVGALSILVVVVLALFRSVNGVPPVNSIPVKVVNHAGAPIEVFWIDTFSPEGNLVRQTSKPLRNSSDANINSYNGHSFVAKFLDDIPGVEAYFTKGPSEETVMITFDHDSNTMNAKQITKFDEIMDLINDGSVTCSHLEGSAFADCVSAKVLDEVKRLTDTTNEIKLYRDKMTPLLYDYVCNDDKPNATEPLRSMTFEDRKETYTLDLMIDTDRAKMWIVPNAITARECELMQQHGVAASQSVIASAATAGSGAEVVTAADGTASLATKADLAKQDSVVPHITYSISQTLPEKDPLWPLFSKTYKMMNYAAKLKLPVLPAGQEGFGVSHYSLGEGVRPHCAGSCGGTYKPGDRVASALYFCKVAEAGGTLMFPKADIVIRPTVGMGVFFAYKPANGTDLDDGYTEHSLCPVRGGSHSVASLHVRGGVAAVLAPQLPQSAEPVKAP